MYNVKKCLLMRKEKKIKLWILNHTYNTFQASLNMILFDKSFWFSSLQIWDALTVSYFFSCSFTLITYEIVLSWKLIKMSTYAYVFHFFSHILYMCVILSMHAADIII